MRLVSCFMLIFMCMLTLLSVPSFGDNQGELDALQQDIDRLQGWLKETQTEHDKLNQKLKQSDENIGTIVKKIERTRNQLKQEKARLKKLQSEQASLRHLKGQHQGQLDKHLISAYKNSDDGLVKVFFSQQDPQQLGRMLKYYEYFNQAHSNKITELVSSLAELKKLEHQILVQRRQLLDTETSLLSQRKHLAKNKQQHQQLLAALDSQLSKSHDQLAQKQKDREHLKVFIKEVVTLLDDSVRRQDARPIRSLKGKLPRPVRGRITKAFGNANQPLRSRWQGWLISQREGSAIQAVHHGRVVFSDWLRGFGLLLIIDHGDDYLSLYARNQSLLKSVGDWVSQGERVATLGASGGFKFPGLYFEIRHKGVPQDPASWLSRG